MVDTHTISMENWTDEDKRAKQLDMNRSQYIQHLVNKDIRQPKLEDYSVIIMLLGFATLITLMIVLLLM